MSTDRADWRRLDNLGELPPKRLRCEVAWPVERLAQRCKTFDKGCDSVGSDCGERSPRAASSTFEWGALPALPMEVAAAEVASEDSPMTTDTANMDDAPYALSRQAQTARSRCTALVPYLKPSAVAASLSTAFLHSGAALRLMPELRISASELALREKVQVSEVIVDEADELYALVVRENQVALAAYRLGQCPRPAETYDEREPGLRIVPVCGSSSSGSGSNICSDMVLGEQRPPTPRPPAVAASHCMDTH